MESMVTPAWFYSTIAQASAAIIGLTIAFTISTHLSRRERRRRRTDKARNEAIQFKQKYQPLLESIARDIQQETQINVDETRYELEDVSTVESWADDSHDPVSGRIWALTSGISNILSDFTLLSAEPTRNQLETMQNAVQELEYNLLYRDCGNDRAFYTEITGQQPEDADGFYYHDDILGDDESISAWLDRNRRSRDENIAGARASDLTGKNIFSLATIMEILEADLDDFGVSVVESDMTADFLQQDFGTHVLSTSLKLAAFGIFFPILFLVSTPDISLPAEVVTVIPTVIFDVLNGIHMVLNFSAQITIVCLSAFYTLRLFTIMRIDMETTVPTMGQLLDVDSEEEEEESENTQKKSSTSRILHLLRYISFMAQIRALPKSLRDEINENSG
jgi:hypothetical protein